MNRMGFIGGSDTVKIMQGDWLDLWKIKTGRSQGEDLSDNIAVQLGIYTEAFNIGWFEKNCKVTVRDQQRKIITDINDIPIHATIDGRIVYNDGKFDIVEAKHTNSYSNMESALEYYMPQIQTYIRSWEAQGAYLTVLFGNNKWEASYVERNNKYFASMWAVVSDFWSYVESNAPPPEASGIKPLNTDKIAVDNMVKRDASKDNQFINSANYYINNQVSAGAFESAKKDLKAMVGDNEREVYSDILSIKRSKNGALRFSQ